MMLTDYSQEGRDNVDKAMESLLRLQERLLGAYADPPNVYADGLYRRMRFDVLEDQDALEGAPHDRVRQCYLAHLRVLGLWMTQIAFIHTNSDITYAWCLTPARSRC
jgi:hypothetical protein